MKVKIEDIIEKVEQNTRVRKYEKNGKKKSSRIDLQWPMNDKSTEMKDQGGIVKTVIRFPRTEKQESPVWKSKPSDQSNERIMHRSKFQNARDNEKILKASRERKSVNIKEWKWEYTKIHNNNNKC